MRSRGGRRPRIARFVPADAPSAHPLVQAVKPYPRFVGLLLELVTPLLASVTPLLTSVTPLLDSVTRLLVFVTRLLVFVRPRLDSVIRLPGLRHPAPGLRQTAAALRGCAIRGRRPDAPLRHATPSLRAVAPVLRCAARDVRRAAGQLSAPRAPTDVRLAEYVVTMALFAPRSLSSVRLLGPNVPPPLPLRQGASVLRQVAPLNRSAARRLRAGDAPLRRPS
jgi:hypothetical protein